MNACKNNQKRYYEFEIVHRGMQEDWDDGKSGGEWRCCHYNVIPKRNKHFI